MRNANGCGQLVHHGGLRLELKARRGQWGVFAAVFLIVGTPITVAVPLLLVEAIVDRNGGALVGVVFGAIGGGVLVPAGAVAWRLARARPAIVVDDDGLTIEHPGFFARPVHLSRAAVHSVSVGSLQGTQRPPRFEGTAGPRPRQTPSSLPISSWHCPDLSLLYVGEDHNLLIVLANSMPMKAFARRGLGALSLGIARGMRFTGPTRATVARGFFAESLNEDLARQAFAPWRAAEAPDPELWDWLDAGTNRGVGWRRSR